MSVRRLAEDAVQPAQFKFTRENASWAKRKIKDYPKGRQASAVIPLLMRAQEQDGWVTKAAIEHVADMLEMPLIRVLEVATFYTQFQLAPVGKRAHIQVCGTTPCMLRGADEIIELCKKRIAPKPFELSEDGNMSWEEVECQGACVNAPMIMIFKDSYEDLSLTQMEHIIDRFAAGKGHEITPGPQVDREFSAPEGGLTSLTSDPTVVAKGGGARTNSAGTKSAGAKSAGAKTKSAGASGGGKKATAEGKSKPARIAGNIGQKSSASSGAGKKTSAAAGVRKTKSTAGVKKTAKPASASAGSKAKASTAKTSKAAAQPKKMSKPKTPDDLKLISGVGPKLEGVLNGLGVWTFKQVSEWKKAERDWVDDHLRFKGRIERDEWVKQAKALAKGGEAEYIRVFGKKPR